MDEGLTKEDKQMEPDLGQLQEESERQALPEQEKVFAVAKRVRQKLHNLPDPARPPLGYVPGKGFDKVFPFIRLPELRPTLNGDWVQFGSPHLEPNRLYYGDNLQVLRGLPSESIDLIYIDPPFFSGAVYNQIWGDSNEVRTFNDIWEGGLNTYLIWLNARLWEMRRVLKSSGSIYVHCDWHASHYIKTEMDKIFGYENFRNELIWIYEGREAKSPSQFNRKHDNIFFYSKSDFFKFNYSEILDPLKESSIKALARYEDEEGRKFILRYKRGGGFAPLEMEGPETYRQYVPEGVTPRDYLFIDYERKKDRIGYPTQKPEALLMNLFKASTNENDIIADFFCGGGTTLAVAQKLNRRWVGCDISRVAVAVTLNRLVKVCEEISGVKSNYFVPGKIAHQQRLTFAKEPVPDIRVVYVGVYPMDRFKAVDQQGFEKFILDCFGASLNTVDEPITGFKTGLEPILVGPADSDSSATPKTVKNFFEACLKHLQPNVKLRAKVIAWKFSPELNQYRKALTNWINKNLLPRNTAMSLEYIPINSQEFRERIVKKFPDSEESEYFLRFTNPPIVGSIKVERIGRRNYKFEAVDAYSTNLDGYLVNCQWDFDYQRGHFDAHPQYILNRKENKGKQAKRKFEAILTAEHAFEKSGEITVACRVQDNLGGETTKSYTFVVED